MLMIKNIFKAIRDVFKREWKLIIVYIVILATILVLTYFPVNLSKMIVDKYDGGEDIKNVVLASFIILLVIYISNVINNIFFMMKEYYYDRFLNKINHTFYAKLTKIDTSFLDEPEFFNDYTRSVYQGGRAMKEVTDGVMMFLISLLASFTLFGYFKILSSFSILLILLEILVYLLLSYIIAKIKFKQKGALNEGDRKKRYFSRAFALKDNMADLKTTNMGECLLDNNTENNIKLEKIYRKYNLISSPFSIISSLCLALFFPGLIYIVLKNGNDGSISNGEITSISVAASQILMLIKLICTSLKKSLGHITELKVPYEYLEKGAKIENDCGIKEVPSFENIDINNITFGYDENKLCLKGIDMHIKKGEKIAIVGLNGSGKTTLVKLLLRLYDPITGNITYNNKDYKDYNVHALRTHIQAVYQSPEIYSGLTIKENILLDKIDKDENGELLKEALEFAGLTEYVNSLENGADTNILKEFNQKGVILSGGFKQRLALARGFARNADLLILDEPSSAIDPLAEAKLYEEIYSYAKDKTIIFISHRLTTTVRADKIYYFENGMVKESGTHTELMNKDSSYKEMFETQSLKYQIGGNIYHD